MSRYVLNVETVKDCLWSLANRDFHRNFPGYLGLKWASAKQGTTTDFQFDYTEFFETFFKVREAEIGKPHIIPFNTVDNPDRDSIRMWLQENVAGSYGPSYREGGPYDAVVASIEGRGTGARWTLEDNHWEIAFEEMCDEQPVQVEYLAGFLFRDFAFETAEPSAETLVTTFQEEFGYESGTDEYDTLYTSGGTDIDETDFEEWSEDA